MSLNYAFLFAVDVVLLHILLLQVKMPCCVAQTRQFMEDL